jgi:hypothetical protein
MNGRDNPLTALFVPRKVRTEARKPTLTWEPVSGIEPLTCRLQEARSRAAHALAAPIARIMALTALAALGLSEDPFHEPFHARGLALRRPVHCA